MGDACSGAKEAFLINKTSLSFSLFQTSTRIQQHGGERIRDIKAGCQDRGVTRDRETDSSLFGRDRH